MVLYQGEDSVRHMEDYSIAVNIAEGRGYSIGDAANFQPTALKAPVYPLFLSVVVYAVPESHRLIACALIQHLLMSIAPLLLLVVLRRFRLGTIAGPAALVLLLHPSYFVYPSTLESTNLFVPLCLVWILALQQCMPSRSMETSGVVGSIKKIAAGIAGAGVLLCQPIVLPIVLYGWNKLARQGTSIAVMAITCLCFMAPWTIRNYIVFNEFIPLKSPVWMNVVTGFSERSHGVPALNTINKENRLTLDSLEHSGSDVSREKVYRNIAIQTISEHPLSFAQKTAVQMWRYWSFPPLYDGSWLSLPFLMGRLLPLLFLIITTVISARYYRYHSHLLLPIWCILAYTTLVYGLTHTSNIRFKLDFEWIQCVAAGVVIHELVSRRFAGRPDTADNMIAA
jgi:hypothetical protein